MKLTRKNFGHVPPNNFTKVPNFLIFCNDSLFRIILCTNSHIIKVFKSVTLFVISGSEYEMIVKFSSDQNNLIGSYSIPVCFSFQTMGDKPFTFIIARFLVSSFLMFFKSNEINSFQNIVVAESLENTEPVAEGKSPFTSNDWPNNIKLIYPNASV